MARPQNKDSHPAIKEEELTNVSLLIDFLSPVLKSSKDIPVIKDTYEGISGSTQGDRKERIPSKKAPMLCNLV